MAYQRFESDREIRDALRALSGGHTPSRRERVRVAIGCVVMSTLVAAMPALLYAAQNVSRITWFLLALASLAGTLFFAWSFWRYANTRYVVSPNGVAYEFPPTRERWVMPASSIVSIVRSSSRDGEILTLSTTSTRNRTIHCFRSMASALDISAPAA